MLGGGDEEVDSILSRPIAGINLQAQGTMEENSKKSITSCIFMTISITRKRRF